MTDLPALIAAFTTLFVIIDPPGLTPIFVALTQGMTPKMRRAILIRAVLISFGLLLAFMFAGEALLGFIGISMPAFRIAGGILLFLTALEMLFQKRQARREDNANNAAEEVEEKYHEPASGLCECKGVSRPGERPGPTVKVRMKESTHAPRLVCRRG